MTDDDIRQIIHRLVIDGSGDDDVDDKMDLEIFRAGMLAAAKICENLTGCADRGEYCAQEIRAAANGPGD